MSPEELDAYLARMSSKMSPEALALVRKSMSDEGLSKDDAAEAQEAQRLALLQRDEEEMAQRLLRAKLMAQAPEAGLPPPSAGNPANAEIEKLVRMLQGRSQAPDFPEFRTPTRPMEHTESRSQMGDADRAYLAGRETYDKGVPLEGNFTDLDIALLGGPTAARLLGKLGTKAAAPALNTIRAPLQLENLLLREEYRGLGSPAAATQLPRAGEGAAAIGNPVMSPERMLADLTKPKPGVPSANIIRQFMESGKSQDAKSLYDAAVKADRLKGFEGGGKWANMRIGPNTPKHIDARNRAESAQQGWTQTEIGMPAQPKPYTPSTIEDMLRGPAHDAKMLGPKTDFNSRLGGPQYAGRNSGKPPLPESERPRAIPGGGPEGLYKPDGFEDLMARIARDMDLIQPEGALTRATRSRKFGKPRLQVQVGSPTKTAGRKKHEY